VEVVKKNAKSRSKAKGTKDSKAIVTVAKPKIQCDHLLQYHYFSQV
jgi:hypothetical protein